MSNESITEEIAWCPVHKVINTQCCGEKKEIWGTMEIAPDHYKEWKGGTNNVQN